MLKIALLFLTIADVYHVDYWKDFLKDHEDRCSIYIHSKEPLPNSSFFKPYEMETKVPTTWENTMKAQFELLKEALKDPDNAKFIFLSESTIPLQTFDVVYNKLMTTDKSIFAFVPNPHQDPYGDYNGLRILNPIPGDLQYKNSQWVVLNRKHAQFMTKETEYTEIICNYPFDNEHYPSTILALYELLHEVINEDTTYVNWKKLSKVPNSNKLPYFFYDLDDTDDLLLVLKAQLSGYLFARKFTKDCDLTPLKKHSLYRWAWN